MKCWPISPLILVAFTGAAFAFDPSTAGRPIDIQQLEQWSRERGEMLRVPEMPRPSQAANREALRPSPVPLTCMSVQAYQPVLAQPRAGAAPIGYTQPQVALIQQKGPWAEILFYNGAAGYLPSSELRPFESTVKRGVKCSVAGLRQSGQPVFDLR